MCIKQHTLNHWVKDETTRETENYFGNENDNTTYPYLQDAVKAVLRRKFRALHTYIKKSRNISKQ